MSILRCAKKEFQLERRGGEVLLPCLLLGLVSSCVAGLTMTTLSIAQEGLHQLYFPLAWVLYFLIGSIGSGRLFEHEWRSGAFVQLELFGIPWWHTYLGKVIFASFTQLILLGTVLTVLSILLQVPLQFSLTHLILLSGVVAIVFGSLAALLSAITVFSPLKAILLPLLTLPLSVPLLFGAIELSLGLQARGELDFASPWLSLIAGVGLFFLLAGVNLIEHIVRE